MVNKIQMIVKFWAICDLSYFGIYLVKAVADGRLPVYSDIIIIFINAESFGSNYIKIFGIVSVILCISIACSGWLLWRQDRKGAIIAYIQAPFRVATITPSLYFIFWPLKYLPQTIGVIIMWILLLSTEGIKIYNISQWRKNILKAG